MTGPDARTKRALLIGIDAYERINPLDGCVNDVHLMREVLHGTFGFPLENMTMLVNEQATRDGILSALDAFVDSVDEGDLVVVHYAGHGSQMTDREGDEPSGLDSTIMPVDSEGWQGDNRDITDDEIHLRLQRLGQKTEYTTLIFDCCHSGTITRDDFGAKARSMPADRRPVSELPPSPIPPELRGGARGNGPSGWMPLGEKYVLISGCRDEELSYEHRPAEMEGKVAHGALTYFLTQQLRRATPGTTYRDVYERAAAQVNAANGRQHPQMEGKADREIFGVRDITPMRHVRVTERKRDQVTLGAGAALGMTVGSRYAVHPQGTKTTENAVALGEIIVTAVRATSSDARIENESAPDAVVAGAYAFETEHAYGDLRFSVELVDEPGHEGDVKRLRDALEAEDILKVVGKGDGGAVRIYRLAERTEVGPTDPVPQLGALREPVWATVGEAGELVMPLQAIASVEAVRNNLRTLARYRQTLALDNPDRDSKLRDKFTLTLLRKQADGTWVDAAPDEASGQIEYEEGEEVAFAVESKHDKPVYVYLLDFGLAGAVHLAHPEAGAQEQLRPEGWFEVGKRGEFEPLGFPDTFPFGEDPVHGVPTSGVETVKLIVTEAPADFSFLNQEGFEPGVATRGVADESPFDALFRSAAGGAKTRDFGRRKVKLEDWTAVVKPFVLRRKRSAALTADDRAVELGGVTIVSPGLQGQAKLHEGGQRAVAAELQAGALMGVLEDAGVEVRSAVEIANAKEVAPSTRSARGADAIEVALRDPGPNHGQILLTTDESGTVTWHFAPPAEPGSRGVGARAAGGTRRYLVPRTVPPPPPAGEAGARGVIGFIGSKLFKELVFPLIDPLLGAVSETFAGRWEAAKRPYRVRSFTPDDYQRSDPGPFDGEAWRKVSGARALLLVHGTFSRAHSAFGAMPREFVETLHAKYGGRVFALDHFTLAHDPKQNVNWLFDQLPGDIDLDLDIICHSRGGLVSRVLSEKQSELSLGSRKLRIGNIVFVGSPNAGTILADGSHMGDFIDTYTNLLNFIPGAGVSDALSGVVTVAKQIAVGAVGGLKGLQSMRPGGEFGQWLNSGERIGDTRYFALTSDFTPSQPGLRQFAQNRLMDIIFKGPNDLVVPTDGVYESNGSGFFPIEEHHVFRGTDSVAHTEFFASRAARDKILEWLSNSG